VVLPYAFRYSGLMKSAMFLGRSGAAPRQTIRHGVLLVERAQRTVMVVVRMWVIGWANVVHLVCRAAFHAAGNGFLTCKLVHVSLNITTQLCMLVTHGNPEHVVGVGGEPRASAVLLITSGVDHNGVLERACNSISRQATFILTANPLQHPHCKK
jgi:hypothetical protein